MAKTKASKQTTSPIDLAKTLKVDEQEYNINAVKAQQVENSLTITKNIFDANGSESHKEVSYNGAEAANLTVVPAEGGHFTGPVSVPTIEEPAFTGDKVLNAENIGDLITNLTGSGWYTWIVTSAMPDPDKKFSVVKKEDLAQHLGVVVSIDAAFPTVFDPALQFTYSFSYNNKEKKYLPKFLGIATDTGNIYYGDSSKDTCTRLAVNADTAKYADKANIADFAYKLMDKAGGEPYSITDLLNAATAASNCYTNSQIDERIADLIAGTTKVKKAELADKATVLATSRTIRVNLASNGTASFNGSTNINPGVSGVLATNNGGTGTNNLDNVTVGKAKQAAITTIVYNSSTNKDTTSTDVAYAKIYFSNRAPKNTDGKNGDIWIYYS